jgi:hypothetical protein
VGGSEENDAVAVRRRSWQGFEFFDKLLKKRNEFLEVFAKFLMRLGIKPVEVIQLFKF